jgi:hypothetical protein
MRWCWNPDLGIAGEVRGSPLVVRGLDPLSLLPRDRRLSCRAMNVFRARL